MPASDHDLLRELLSTRHIPCPGCGYDLHGLATQRCPECSQDLALRVNLSEPRLGPWIAMLAAHLAAFGAALVCILLVAYLAITDKGWPAGREFFPIVVYPYIVAGASGGVAGLLMRPAGRRWVRTTSREARWAALCVSWALLLGYVALFVVMID
ncbi:MAG: hypothetical protein AB7K52_13215 [Phycisphaerales bacterium]